MCGWDRQWEWGPLCVQPMRGGNLRGVERHVGVPAVPHQLLHQRNGIDAMRALCHRHQCNRDRLRQLSSLCHRTAHQRALHISVRVGVQHGLLRERATPHSFLCGGPRVLPPMLQQLAVRPRAVPAAMHQWAVRQRNVQRVVQQQAAQLQGLLLDALHQQLGQRMRLGLQRWLFQEPDLGQLQCLQDTMRHGPIYLLCVQHSHPGEPRVPGLQECVQCLVYGSRAARECVVVPLCLQHGLLASKGQLHAMDSYLPNRMGLE